ncbi:hypothetical protein, partial [uncultured Megamonas sp.]|uniref:hypothetical protein n=1 Tax=uncultured Megamonas sp. TaxID=286140 RepID=UPI0025F336FB
MTPLIVIYIKAITLQPLELWLFSLLLSKSYTNKKRTDKNELHPKSWTKNNFWRCSFFMTKYSNEFKVKAIKMVLKGASI